MKATDTLSEALKLISGDRENTHGPKARNHQNIATLWNAYMAIRFDPHSELTAADVARMMGLLKVARTQLGAYNPDDGIDGAAYFAIAGELEADGA